MPVNIRGKSYLTVAERLMTAHGPKARPSGITSISTTVAQTGSWSIVTAVVAFADGRVFTGMSEIARGTGAGPQASMPVEVAETSAVGRALAFAGWLGDGAATIAGAEEVQRAEARSQPVRMGRTEESRR